MIKTYEKAGVSWIDLTSPTKEEVRELMNTYNLSLSVAEELLFPSPKPKLELYDDNFYLILHFPAAKHTHSTGSRQEVDFIVGKDIVITSRYDSIDPVHKFSKELEIEALLSKKKFEKEKEHGGHMFYALIMKIYASFENELEYVQSAIDEVEENIFRGREKDMVREISNIGRTLLDFKQAIASHTQVLDSLDLVGRSFFGDEFSFYINKIIDEHYRITLIIERLKETVLELRETNNSLLTTKQNEVMKTLTIMAFVTFPLTLMAALFGMNTKYTPFIGEQYDFWIVTMLMGLLTVVFFIYFKYKKWL